MQVVPFSLWVVLQQTPSLQIANRLGQLARGSSQLGRVAPRLNGLLVFISALESFFIFFLRFFLCLIRRIVPVPIFLRRRRHFHLGRFWRKVRIQRTECWIVNGLRNQSQRREKLAVFRSEERRV